MANRKFGVTVLNRSVLRLMDCRALVSKYRALWLRGEHGESLVPHMLIDCHVWTRDNIFKSVDGLIHWLPEEVSIRGKDGTRVLRKIPFGERWSMRKLAETALVNNYDEIVHGIQKRPGFPAECMSK